MDRLKLAKDFMEAAHKGQERKFTGEPYEIHPRETVQILWDVSEGTVSNDEYIAAILHDTVEDTPISLSEIGRVFGGNVMGLVDELTNDDAQKEKLGKKEYLVKKLNEISTQALTIKLCDRLSNVMGLTHKKIPISFVKWYLDETSYILSKLNRSLSSIQEELIKRISSAHALVTITREL